jgi:hypothetical protein
MRFVSLLYAGLLIAGELHAHDVIWWVTPTSPSYALDFYYPSELYDYIIVAPSTGEPCTVVVNLDAPSSTLVSAQVLLPNPDNVVEIRVQVLRAPNTRRVCHCSTAATP